MLFGRELVRFFRLLTYSRRSTNELKEMIDRCSIGLHIASHREKKERTKDHLQVQSNGFVEERNLLGNDIGILEIMFETFDAKDLFHIGFNDGDQTETTTNVRQKTRPLIRVRIDSKWITCRENSHRRSNRDLQDTKMDGRRHLSVASPLCLRMELSYSNCSLVMHRKSG